MNQYPNAPSHLFANLPDHTLYTIYNRIRRQLTAPLAIAIRSEIRRRLLAEASRRLRKAFFSGRFPSH